MSNPDKISPNELNHFSDAMGADLLYPFRFLGLEFRLAAAKYIVDKNLDADVRAGMSLTGYRANQSWSQS